MRIEICIAKEKMTKMPNGAVDALPQKDSIAIIFIHGL
ncbi:DNA damage-inducible protein [Escherichia coli]|nr:DNA damage-inducible protein [Escherichia coli]CTV36378.1 DNA damage-inducible protein [Escherichia coli]CTV39439.1 DNA damage-inducible protein [Escherichia coli]CTV48413.1 DNA damage-inducible protein [Escherichia coli]